LGTVPDFGLTQPDDDTTGAAPAGVGEAADGQIRAELARDGRLRMLTISPNLLRHNRGGSALDSRALTAEITHAVNAAIDDLNRRTTQAAVPTALIIELSQVKTDLDRAIDDARSELERAERRIADR
jgi:hypothetical protein